MHNFTKSTSSTDLQRPHESYSWPFKKLSNKYFRASHRGRGRFVARLFSPTLSRFFHAPAAGDTGTPLFKIVDPPLCIVHKHKTLPHSNPQSIPVPFPSQPPSPFQCLHSSAILQSNLPLQVNPVKRITIQGIREHLWFQEDLPSYLFPLPGDIDSTQIDSAALAEVCQKLSVKAAEVGDCRWLRHIISPNITA